jgi:predicted TIM-barrel enzyme
MPGYPAFTSIDAIVDAALADLERLEAGGVDGALVENDFDQPHTMVGGAEIHAAMTRVTREVVARARIPIGVEVLLNDWRASLAIAAMTGARFIRIDFFVDRVMTKLGPFEPEPEAILAYRQAIKAEQVQLFTDLQVKYTTPIGGPKPLALSAREAAAAGGRRGDHQRRGDRDRPRSRRPACRARRHRFPCSLGAGSPPRMRRRWPRSAMGRSLGRRCAVGARIATAWCRSR